ncbi:MAG: hypothetical protein J0H57_13310, partial [Rhodospirillales bacterium]|nr:hypothetical protein [Rhodospirillales bacterium]
MPFRVEQDEVGEGAADIEADAVAGGHGHADLLGSTDCAPHQCDRQGVVTHQQFRRIVFLRRHLLEDEMAQTNAFTLVMLPPQTDVTRAWAARLGREVPEVRVVVAEDEATADRAIVDAEAAFGWITPAQLASARKLLWLQAPQAAPAAGYYFPELVAHRLSVTNFREIFNDHIGAHILAFVLAFARGLHVFIPQQLRREWKKSDGEDEGVIHLPEATALIVGLGGIGAEAARLLRTFGVTVLATDARRTSKPADVAELHPPEALDVLLPRADFVILTVPHTPATEGFFNRARFQRMKRSAFFINIG